MSEGWVGGLSVGNSPRLGDVAVGREVMGVIGWGVLRG